MELVVGRQRLDRRAVRIDAVIQQGRMQPRQQVASGVVAGNLVVGAHAIWLLNVAIAFW